MRADAFDSFVLPKRSSRGTVSSSTIVLLDTVRLLLGFRGARVSKGESSLRLGLLSREENQLERAFDPTPRCTSDPTRISHPPSPVYIVRGT